MKTEALQRLEDYLQGMADCEQGLPPQKTTEYYESGYAAKYWQIEAASFRSDQLRARESNNVAMRAAKH